MGLYDDGLDAAMEQAFEADPAVAALTCTVLNRLKARNYYEQEIVDAIFQPFLKGYTLADAFAFLCVYGRLVTGKLRIARIGVGATPSKDNDVEGNNQRLRGLPPQFEAEFWGGATDHDGVLRWHNHCHFGGYINVDQQLVDGPIVTINANELPLEVGYQSAAKTLFMTTAKSAGRGVARWPYGSSDVWVICNTERFAAIKTACVADEDGWPCARTRGQAAP